MIERLLKENPGIIERLTSRPQRLLHASVAGSHSYGTAHEASDWDIRGFSIEPTDSFLGLLRPDEQLVITDPDVVIYEIGKLFHLAAGGNPGALEILFAPDILFSDPLGEEVIANRSIFVSQRVRNRYLGYATQQMVLAQRIESGEAASGRFQERTRSKHLLHLLRLLDQGYGLYTTGHLEVRASNPQELRAKAKLPLAEVQDEITALMTRLENATSPLPEEVDMEAVGKFLIGLRKRAF